MPSIKAIAIFFSYLLVAVVYSAFFFVQVTSNFDIPAGVHQAAYVQQAGIKKVHTASVKKVKIRLNKRFHPVSATDCPVYPAKDRFVYFVNPALSAYSCSFIVSDFFNNYPRRGPPVFA